MALTSDNIQTIKQFADKLEKWANNLSYSKSQTKNFWVELILFFYPQDLQVTVSWLANIPTIGQKVQKDFEELSKMIHKVDIWHIQGVCQEEFGEFGALIDRLKKTALNIVFTLRKISDTGRSDLPVTEAITLEKSNTSELLETKPARMEPEGVPTKPLRKEALMAYNLHYKMGLTQSQVAKRMSTELKLGKPVRQWEVSRWIKQVENWRIRTGLSVDSVLKKGKKPNPLVLNDRPC
jgi:hypothetical protein